MNSIDIKRDHVKFDNINENYSVTARMKQITEILNKELSLVSLAKRYATVTLHHTSPPDPKHLRAQVRELIQNDSPSVIVKEIFGLFFEPELVIVDINAKTMLSGNRENIMQWSFLSTTIHSTEATNFKPERSLQPILKSETDLTTSRKNLCKDSARDPPAKRLMELFHSATCKNDTTQGDCNVSRHCMRLKRLWDHIERCNRKKCDFSHCRSSRVLLSHYNRCHRSRCDVCDPVRDAARSQNLIAAIKAEERFDTPQISSFKPFCVCCLSLTKTGYVCCPVGRLRQMDETSACSLPSQFSSLSPESGHVEFLDVCSPTIPSVSLALVSKEISKESLPSNNLKS